MPADLLIASDRRLMRDGMRAILKSCPEFHVIIEAENCAEGIAAVRDEQPRIVIADAALPERGGAAAIAEMLRIRAGLAAILVCVAADELSVREANACGATRWLARGGSEEDLLAALSAASGRPPREPSLARPVLETLSPRESQVLRLVAEGRTSKEIAVALSLGIETVRGYRKSMMRKLGVSNAAAVTHRALTHFQ